MINLLKKIKYNLFFYNTKRGQGYISYFIENNLGATGKFLLTIIIVTSIFSLDPNRNYGFLIFSFSMSLYLSLYIYRSLKTRNKKFYELSEKLQKIGNDYSSLIKERKLIIVKNQPIDIEIISEIKNKIQEEGFLNNMNIVCQIKLQEMKTYQKKVLFDRLSNYMYVTYQGLNHASVTLRRRGVFEVLVEVKVQDLLNVLQKEISHYYMTYYVLPQLKDVDSINQQIQRVMKMIVEKESDLTKENLNQDIDIKSLRQYVPGDPIKMIHWKKSFKNNPFETGNFIVKEMEEEASLKKNLYIDLDSKNQEEFENYMTFISSFLLNQGVSIQNYFNEIYIDDTAFKSSDLQQKEVNHQLVKKLCEAQYEENKIQDFQFQAQTDFFILFFSKIEDRELKILEKIPHQNFLIFLINSDSTNVKYSNVSFIQIEKELYDF